jgi:hypothetical protein
MRFRITVNTKLCLFVQNCFVLIGVSASGAVAGALVVITLIRALFVPETTSEWNHLGAVYLLIFFVPASLLLGGIAGCVGAWSWVRQHTSRRWGTATWVGILLGLILGLTWSSTVFDNSDFPGKLLNVLVSAASATLVGTAVSYITAFRNDSKHRP